MILVDHSKRLSEPMGWTRGGRVAVLVAAVLLVGGAVAAIVASSTGGGRLAPGCIEVTFASTLGAAAIHPCGVHAREMCANPAQNPGLAEHGALREACRKAGIPYGTGASPKPPISG